MKIAKKKFLIDLLMNDYILSYCNHEFIALCGNINSEIDCSYQGFFFQGNIRIEKIKLYNGKTRIDYLANG